MISAYYWYQKNTSEECQRRSKIKKQGSGVYNTTLLFNNDGISAVELHLYGHFRAIDVSPQSP